ncbi:hypothetical protein [Embleya hyalina]|uniref:Uncharacterized protein n=1 Tax=Embleya hyalina TaxID=516124 RepID=A0A401YQD5_9ACTN|nr:hypothetical protein [Embleya hyalina]GCD96810.1 hypothetical protein EHYA_04497 [Embleya hyalina]
MRTTTGAAKSTPGGEGGGGGGGDGRRRRAMSCPRCLGASERCTHTIGESAGVIVVDKGGFAAGSASSRSPRRAAWSRTGTERGRGRRNR